MIGDKAEAEFSIDNLPTDPSDMDKLAQDLVDDLDIWESVPMEDSTLAHSLWSQMDLALNENPPDMQAAKKALEQIEELHTQYAPVNDPTAFRNETILAQLPTDPDGIRQDALNLSNDLSIWGPAPETVKNTVRALTDQIFAALNENPPDVKTAFRILSKLEQLHSTWQARMQSSGADV